MTYEIHITITEATSFLQDVLTVLSKYVPLPMLLVDKEHFILHDKYVQAVNIEPKMESKYLDMLKEQVKDFLGAKQFDNLISQVYKQISKATRKK